MGPARRDGVAVTVDSRGKGWVELAATGVRAGEAVAVVTRGVRRGGYLLQVLGR